MIGNILISLLLLIGSAFFSGLTLGYFTLETQTLRRQAKLGDARAKVILPLREKGNQLLTTLLLGNVATNAILSVYLATLVDGVIAAAAATVLIFLFGEMIPQAVFARYAKWIGSTAAPLVRIIMFIETPITWPIATVLNWMLGHESPSIYSKHEIMEIVSEHEDSDQSSIDADEERIVHGALKFSHKTVREAMTPAEKVIRYDVHQRLTPAFFREINSEGFSRFPIYSGNENNIIGVLFTKDLLTEDEGITVSETTEAFQAKIMRVRPDEFLDSVLGKMLKRGQHLATVQNGNKKFLGVISLEDIIEEIIQHEIEDEDDTDDRHQMHV